MNAMRTTRWLGAAGAAVLVWGCSMTAEWWISKSMREAGFTRAEARCVVEGVSANLDREQIWSIRSALSGLAREPRDLAALLEAVRPELEPEVHGVLVHYGTHCTRRTRAQGVEG